MVEMIQIHGPLNSTFAFLGSMGYGFQWVVGMESGGGSVSLRHSQ